MLFVCDEDVDVVVVGFGRVFDGGGYVEENFFESGMIGCFYLFVDICGYVRSVWRIF